MVLDRLSQVGTQKTSRGWRADSDCSFSTSLESSAWRRNCNLCVTAAATHESLVLVCHDAAVLLLSWFEPQLP
jgi:hypothetical protein